MNLLTKSNMKRASLTFFLSGIFLFSTFAQTENGTGEKRPNLDNRPKDHVHFQFGSLMWLQTPDSVFTKGLSRSFNAYFCFDLPFKSDPRFSIGIGVGIGSDHMFFDKNARKDLDITGERGLRFRNLTGIDTNIRYRSIKLHTAYLEAPVELRFMAKPHQHQKSWKFALGMKVGTLVTAVDKTRFERDAVGNRAYNTKVKDRKNFNNLRLAGYARIGYGNIGLFFQYQLNDFIKEGQGPNQIRPFQVGITFSGL
jgi:hypothetical protein